MRPEDVLLMSVLCVKSFIRLTQKLHKITLIQPKITYCLSTFWLHVGSLHQDWLPLPVGRQYVKACPIHCSVGSSPRLNCDRLGECQGGGSRIRQSWQAHREAICIRKTDNMNRDWGSYQLSHVWTSFYILTTGTGSQSWWRLLTWSRNVDKQINSMLFWLY